MVNTYRQWVDGAEEFPEEDQKLEDNYGESFFRFSSCSFSRDECSRLERAELTFPYIFLPSFVERKFADIIESGEALHNEVANQEAEFKALTSEPVSFSFPSLSFFLLPPLEFEEPISRLHLPSTEFLPSFSA